MSVGRVFCVVTLVMLGGSLAGVPGFAQQQPASGGASGGGADQGGTGAPGGGTGVPGAVGNGMSKTGVGTSTSAPAQNPPAGAMMMRAVPPASNTAPAQQ